MDYYQVDIRCSATHFVANRLVNFDKTLTAEAFRHKGNVLSYVVNKSGLNTPFHTNEVVSKLEDIETYVLSQDENFQKRFAAQVIEPNELEKLKKAWRTFNPTKAKLAKLADLSLVIPPPEENFAQAFNHQRRLFRAKAHEAMVAEELVFNDFKRLIGYGEVMLKTLEGTAIEKNCSELLQEYLELQDELYCETMALS